MFLPRSNVALRLLLVAALGLAVAGGLATDAQAARWDSVFARSEQLATQAFTPTCSQPWVYFAAPPAGVPGADSATAWALEDKCAVHFSWNSLPRLVEHPEEFCGALVHEWGHLAGREHAADPGDVMYSGGPAVSRYEPCRRAFAPEIEARKRSAARRARTLRRLRARVRQQEQRINQLERRLARR